MGKFSTVGKIGLVLLAVFALVFPGLDLFNINVTFRVGDRGYREGFDALVAVGLVVFYVGYRRLLGKSGLWEKGESERYPKVLDGDATVVAAFLSMLLWYVLRVFEVIGG